MPLTPREVIKEAARLAVRYRVDKGKGFRLKRFDSGDTAGFDTDFFPVFDPARRAELASARRLLTGDGRSRRRR